MAAKTIARVELAEGAEDIATRVRGKLRWFTIGQHGRITADEARAAALEILALTKKGIDPREADAKRKAEPVMAELGRRFLEEYVPVHCKPSTQAEYRRSVKCGSPGASARAWRPTPHAADRDVERALIGQVEFAAARR